MGKHDAEGNNPPVLPGLEEFALSTLSPQPRKMRQPQDLYNLRLLAGSRPADMYGFPVLRGHIPSHISRPLVFHEARALYRKKKSLRGYFIHFFIDDERFECIRKSPGSYLSMLKSADFIVAPDFSTYRNYPFPVLLKNAFDNLLLACYFERNNIPVVANVIWSRPLFYDFTFSGQPVGGAIFISSISLRLTDKKGIQHWLHGYREALKRLNPKMVIRIGKVIPGEDDVCSNPIRVAIENPYVKRLRHGR